MKLSKRMKSVSEKVDAAKEYTLLDAIKVLKSKLQG